MANTLSDNKKSAILQQMEELNINENDIDEKFIKGSGPGGQKINKTASCVYLHHKPTGIEIKCQTTRSQASNRLLARRELCEKVAAKLANEITKKQQEQYKIRKQKKRRSRRSKEKMLSDKKHRSEIKDKRKSVDKLEK